MRINEKVRRMYPPRYTRSQAAVLVGRDVDTLKRWQRDGVFGPSDTARFGRTVVHLYTDEDIEAMRQIAKGMKPGRRPNPAKSA